MKEQKTVYYGEGGRLSKSANNILIDTAYTHDCNDADILLPYLHKADLSHAMMLAKQNIIEQKDAKVLLEGLLQLEKLEIKIDPKYGDVYNSKDVALQALIGEDFSGWIHIARARREAVNISYLLNLKEKILTLASSLEIVLSVMIEKSEQSKDILMPDFTYLHHAQPTTFAHYILTFAYPMLRDIKRLKEVYKKIDCSPAGASSVNGSSLNLDRRYMKELLGFGSISKHARDAMWQVDVPIEAMSLLNIIMTNINRFVDELQIWNTSEFNMVSLPDDICRASVIMPQKKNPYALTYIRGVCSSLSGKISEYIGYGKIPSGNPDSRIFIYGDLPRSIEKVCGAMDLFTHVITNMELKSEVMNERVKNQFIYASELSEYFSLNYNLSYKKSHKLVGAIVSYMIESNIKPYDINIDIVSNIAKEKFDLVLDLTDDKLSLIIDPQSIIKSRKTIGSASDEELDLMLKELARKRDKFSKWLNEKEKNFTFNYLYSEVQKYLKN